MQSDGLSTRQRALLAKAKALFFGVFFFFIHVVLQVLVNLSGLPSCGSMTSKIFLMNFQFTLVLTRNLY